MLLDKLHVKNKVIIFLIIICVVLIGGFIFNRYKYSKRADIKVPVLLYHNFVTEVPDSDPDNFNYINIPESFEENIKTFLENGYYSNYEYIYPILKKYNIKASIFIVTDKIGQEIDGIKYLRWEECLEMQNSGLVEIFSHSKKHVFYNKLPVREIRDDVKESYKLIEEHLGKQELKVFAYPYGAYTKETVRTLQNNGIDFQIYDIGINNFKTLDRDFIKRINIPCEMTGQEIIEEIL